MQQAIDIRTLDGQRFDVDPDATIELNMGGISLLNLQDRTASYTNNFKLPKTPNNDLIFEFAASFSRTNKPSIPVFISKGLFQKKATLKIVDVSKDYNCSLSFATTLDTLKNLNMDFIEPKMMYEIEDPLLYGDFFYSITSTIDTRTRLKKIKGNTNIITSSLNVEGNPDTYGGDLFISVDNYFKELITFTGITITGDLLTDFDFLSLYLNMPNYGYSIEEAAGGGIALYEGWITSDRNATTVADVISCLAKLFLAEVVFTDTGFEINKLNLTSEPIVIESIDKINSKDLVPALEKDNYIKYTCDGDNKFFGADKITGDGLGIKDLLTINAVIPKTDSVGYITSEYDSVKDKIIFMIPGNPISSQYLTLGGYAANPTTTTANVLSLSGFYSTPLNPIFANTFIVKADKKLDMFTADKIMKARKIRSIELGGDYWVDEMAYNLTTGQSKMKLIKLP